MPTNICIGPNHRSGYPLVIQSFVNALGFFFFLIEKTQPKKKIKNKTYQTLLVRNNSVFQPLI